MSQEAVFFPPEASQRNAAARLLSLCERATAGTAQQAETIETHWAALFRLPKLPKEERVSEVSRLLLLAHDEVKRVQNHLLSMGVSEDTAQLALKEPRRLLHLGSLESRWHPHHQAKWGQAGKVGLSLAADLMGTDSESIPKDTWLDLDQLAGELQEATLSPEMPHELARRLRDHARVVREALRAFTVKGSVALSPLVDDYLEIEARIIEEAKPTARARAREALEPLWGKLRPVLRTAREFLRVAADVGRVMLLLESPPLQLNSGEPPLNLNDTPEALGPMSEDVRQDTSDGEAEVESELSLGEGVPSQREDLR